MWKLILLDKNKKLESEQGFITLEIIVSLLIALAFVAVAMQSLVYAMAMKVQAQEKQRANQLIQEDIERLNELGSNPSLTANCDPATFADGYAKELWDELQAEASGTDTTTSVTKNLLTSGTGRNLGLRRIYDDVGNNSTDPHRTLKIRYEVWEWSGGNFVDDAGNTVDASTTDDPIAETYVEVIPDVALACP